MTDHAYELPPPDETLAPDHAHVHVGNGAAPTKAREPWLIDAADLLAEPDPGPTPWLVENLIVDQAIVAAVGRWKTTKSYGLLDICISIATGRPAFGKLTTAPGPVVFINEESGRAALWRRLDSLCRGRAINPEELRGRLHVAPNARVKLDDETWQHELLTLGQQLQPRLYVFDPLARMKAPAREENAQTDMAVLVEFIRHLRDDTGAAVAFVHHTGHAGIHMRGSSDLESVWETRLQWTRDGQASQVEIASEHREAEAGPPLNYRINWHAETRTIRFDLEDETGPTLADRILEHIQEHGPGTTDEIREAVGVRKSDVARTLDELERAATLARAPSGRRDSRGRPINDKVWKLADQAVLWPVPDPAAGPTTGPTTMAGPTPGPTTKATPTKTAQQSDLMGSPQSGPTGTNHENKDNRDTVAPPYPATPPLGGGGADGPPDEPNRDNDIPW